MHFYFTGLILWADKYPQKKEKKLDTSKISHFTVCYLLRNLLYYK